MQKQLVDVVAALLGKAPTHMYDYDMQPTWKLRARQWVADQRRPEAVYPIHCWSAGYGGPQSPMTWFACKTCGKRELGSPHELPDRGCMLCLFDGSEFVGWAVADPSAAFAATLEATKGMSSHSFDDVMNGPR